MANYTPEDVNAALQEGLISEEDAQYLLGALEPSGVPGAVGATLGGIAGGAAGAKYGGKALSGAMGKAGTAMQGVKNPLGGVMDKAGAAMQGVKNPLGGLMKKGAPDAPMVPKGSTKGPQLNADGSIPGAAEDAAAAAAGMRMPSPDAMAGGLGALGAGAAGGMLGSTMDNPQGVEGDAVVDHANKRIVADRDMALRMLMDPNVPAAKKRQILASLQQLDAKHPPAEAGYGERGGGAMSALLGGIGAVGGGMIGGTAGGSLSGRLAGQMAGGAAGAGVGGLAGVSAGDMMFGKKSPYEEPF
jgi:hypothetical protein